MDVEAGFMRGLEASKRRFSNSSSLVLTPTLQACHFLRLKGHWTCSASAQLDLHNGNIL